MQKTTYLSDASVYIDKREIEAMRIAIEDDMFAGTTLADLRDGRLDREWDKRMNEIKAQLKQERRAEADGEDEA
jgi:hypothetical protein